MGEEATKAQPLSNPALKWALGIAAAGSLIATVVGVQQFYTGKATNTSASPTPTPTIAPSRAVTALGRLEPQGEVIKLSASSSVPGAGSRLDKLLVSREGDNVKKGQIVAVLDSRDRLQAAFEKAQQQVKVAQANLAKVRAGAKSGEIVAQEAEIARTEAQQQREIDTQRAEIARLEAQQQREIDTQRAEIARLEAQRQREIDGNLATIARTKADYQNARKECDRYERLYQQGAVTASNRDTKCLEMNTTQARLNEATANLRRVEETSTQQIRGAKSTLNRIQETGTQQVKGARFVLNRIQETGTQQVKSAKANLNRISEVRSVDVDAASAEVQSAIAALKQAQADLDLAYVKSPINGQVLKIHTRVGETVSSDGIVELGKTDQMYVVAEIYESDIDKVREGQKVIVSSNGFDWKLKGTVAEKGMKIAKKDVLNTDPAADVDARIVEVKIRLDSEDSKKVTGLTNLQVEVKIDLEEKTVNSN